MTRAQRRPPRRSVIRAAAAAGLALSLCPAGRGASLPTADFLDLPVDARSVAMAESGQAAAAGAGAAASVTPLALLSVPAHEVYFTHGFLMAGIGYDFVSYGASIKSHRLGLSYQHLGYGDLELRDNAGNLNGEFQPSDSALTMSYAAPLGSAERLKGPAAAGMNLRYVRRTILETADAWTMDLAVRYRPAEDISLALAGTNIFGSMRFERESEPLPAAVKGGVSWTPLKEWLVSLDVAGPIRSGSYMAIGTEYVPKLPIPGRVAGRMGFNTRTIELGGFSGMKAGFGYAWRAVGFDYAFSPYGGLGDSHHIGVSYRFGGGAEDDSDAWSWRRGGP